MRKILVSATIALACLAIALFYRTRSAAAGSVIINPFTAALHEVRFTSTGAADHEETYVVAYRSDGSSVTDYHRTLGTGQTVEIKVVQDPATRRKTAVDYASESTTTYSLPSNYLAELAKQSSACRTISAPAEEPILGYSVVLVHDGHTYGNGASNVNDRWEAPELNCFALRSVDYATRQPGQKGPHNEVAVTNIVVGEPNLALFSIPEHFVERSPSERHAEFERRFGIPAPLPSQADEVYNAGRDNRK
jgi:hypothetical protein